MMHFGIPIKQTIFNFLISLFFLSSLFEIQSSSLAQADLNSLYCLGWLQTCNSSTLGSKVSDRITYFLLSFSSSLPLTVLSLILSSFHPPSSFYTKKAGSGLRLFIGDPSFQAMTCCLVVCYPNSI